LVRDGFAQGSPFEIWQVSKLAQRRWKMQSSQKDGRLHDLPEMEIQRIELSGSDAICLVIPERLGKNG
jgi:hypothetical protein